MKKLLRMVAATLFGLSLATGAVAAQTGSIDYTGPESENVIEFNDSSDVELDNETDVNADVTASQTASTGEAKVGHNTTGRNATSGDADNSNEVEADVEIDNSAATRRAFAAAGCGCDHEASIDTTGPHSENRVEFNNESEIDVTNDTDVDFNSSVSQSANSGDAGVYGNTTGGSATSGDASNSNSTVFTLSVTN